MQRAAVVYNACAHNPPDRRRLIAAAGLLRQEGWEVDFLYTEAPGHGIALAREAALAGADVVFACGGDGTINEVANGLVDTPATLGVVRGGMGDVFAKEVRVPREPAAALRLLLDGQRPRFDLGWANERYFLLMAGIGFDGDVVHNTPPRAKRLLGSGSHVLWAFLQLPRYHSPRARLVLDGEALEAPLYWLLLGNTRSYGGVIDIASHARADDGLLEAYLFAGEGVSWALANAARIALRRHEGAAGVSYRRVREVAVETAGIPVQLDGEDFGVTPAAFGVRPAALPILVPRGGADRLVGGA